MVKESFPEEVMPKGVSRSWPGEKVERKKNCLGDHLCKCQEQKVWGSGEQ